jgi:multiple sugar transport system substrate-binding protein
MRKISVVFTFVLLLLGCSDSHTDKNVIQFWQFWSDTNTMPVIEKLVSEFESENPGVKVKITDLTWANGHDKLVISFAAHQPPDVMELGSDWVAEFASNDLLTDFQSVISRMPDGGDWPQNYLYPATWKGNLYAIPWLLDSRIFYINVDLLKRAGVDIPKNWDELRTACEKIHNLGDDYFGFGCNSSEKHVLYKKFLPFLWSNGGQVLDSSASKSEIDSKAAVEALSYYLDLCNCGAIESQRRLEEYFREGKIGFVISGGWLLKRLQTTPPAFDYRLVPFFTPQGDPGISFFGGEYIAVYSKTPKIEMARKLAEFLTRKENSQQLCNAAGFGFPPYRNLEISNPEKRIEAEQLIHSISTPPTPVWVDIEQDLEDAIEAAMYHHGTPEKILSEASRTIDNKLKSGENAATK